jgi:hypothetical protein
VLLSHLIQNIVLAKIEIFLLGKNSKNQKLQQKPCITKRAASNKNTQLNNNNNHSILLLFWNLKIIKDTVRLLPFHLRMLPCAVTIAHPFGSSTGTYTFIQPFKQERV